jgi:uncharacterized membrane protein YfcA
MDWGGLGETVGVALVGVGVFVGWRLGPKAEKKFDRAVSRAAVGVVVLVLLVFLIWWAIAGFPLSS